MNVYIETYGCQMNEYDSELMIAILESHGYVTVPEPEHADIVLLNTCSVRESAARRIYARVHDIRRQVDHPLQVGVVGCMATDYKERLIAEKKLPVDFIAGPDSYRRLPELIRKHAQTGERQMDVTLSRQENYDGVLPVRSSGVNAWIAVMRGCNNFCSFCVVPYTRGRERSRPVDSVLAEVRQLVQDGFKQVTLLGQNVNSYQYDDHSFADLLNAVSEVDGIERIRFTSPHPKDFPADLIRTVADNPAVCKHIHLPLQAGNSRVLDLMRRTYTKESYLQLAADIKRHIPDIALTTRYHCRIPTETDAEFKDTVDVMRQVQFDSAFIFKYSERQGTLAQKHYEDDVPEEVKTERIVYLNELQKETSLSKNQAHIGQTLNVLLEQDSTKKSNEHMQGRSDGNKLVILKKGDYRVGDSVRVHIDDAGPHVLRGHVID
ncbi:MAG: tRNA (N6-isopentenyl adenosine(37)-C2)-methylthiotransferase MiaB [candidate division KSB1 bacterium]|nr:tRNA (N6-isopentenyl adenosine(37)-C2)-methylthiotransferase MiaB [candidate division KSB1 bacterium]